MLRQASRIARPLANTARAAKTRLTTGTNAKSVHSERSVAAAKAFSTLPNAAVVPRHVLATQPLAAPAWQDSLPGSRAQPRQHVRLNSSLSRDAIRQTDSFNHGLKTILALLSERGSWNYAEAWVPHESSQVMNCKATWADDTFTAVKDFQEAAMSIQLRKGKGEAGRVWESGAPSWVESLRFNGRARINGAEGAGLSSGMAVPILMGDEVMAVLHFYTTTPTAPSQDMMEDFSRHGTMLLAAQNNASMRPVLSPMATGSSGEAVMTQAKMDAIYDRVTELGAFERSTVYEDVDWFVNRLGLPRTYFERFSANEIARHVSAYISAKKLASVVDESTGDEMRNEIETTVQSPTSLVIMRPATREAICEVEMLIDEMRNRCRAEHRCLTTARFRTSNTAVPYGNCELMVWILDNEEYLYPDVDEYERDVYKLTSEGHQKRSKHIFPQFQELVNQKQDRLSPLITRGPAMDDGTVPVVVGLKSTADKELRSARGFNLLIAELLGHDLVVRRKYATTCANGLVFHNLYIDPASDERIGEFMDDIRLIALTPKTNLEQLLLERELVAPEYCYAVCAANFIYYFMKDQNEDLKMLRSALAEQGETADQNMQRLDRLALHMQQEAVTPMRIEETMVKYPNIMKKLYADFQGIFDPEGPSNPRAYNDELAALINREVPDDYDRKFLKTALVMNESLLKTNFYKDRKSSLSFRFDPSFLNENDRYPETPFGIFMLLGSDFRGFHVRFRDVARGGIRLIPSRDRATYARNRQMVFAENYGLAHTQNAKNKDIPEFGSKGTILLEPNAQSGGRGAFYKYISGMFDLMLPKEEVVDHYGQEEILFFGPDEGTADVMEWACDYAKARGYPYWKSITTGKPPSMGGIPHDTYGMTTLSVHEYAKGVLEKEGVAESSVTKLQTGGPDGDLGSNEILISEDMTTSIVDGSGVLHDPAGLDRTELNKLADERVMIEAFDTSKLSSDGFRVLVNENDVSLPSGEVISDGVRFRNAFHLNSMAKADLFVPCGGRPESINASNVNALFDDETGEPNFKYIVEGANLFITEDARSTLAAAGVILFKDASTNKGGVTSSSLEVLAALALTDDEFDEHMRVPNNVAEDAPKFYQEYVHEITEIVKNNARQEFEVLWQEHAKTGLPRHRLTDMVSNRINELNVNVQTSSLWENAEIRRKVLSKALPQKLQQLVGLDTLLKRLPEPYQQAVFGYYIASSYVYETGMPQSGAEFSFFEYMKKFSNE